MEEVSVLTITLLSLATILSFFNVFMKSAIVGLIIMVAGAGVALTADNDYLIIIGIIYGFIGVLMMWALRKNIGKVI